MATPKLLTLQDKVDIMRGTKRFDPDKLILTKVIKDKVVDAKAAVTPLSDKGKK